jgi:hypothetical protein
MNRRNFIRGMALLAAGAAALPEQIDFFERYYTANAPASELLGAMDEVWMSGTALVSMPVTLRIFRVGTDENLYTWGINLLGGVLRWVPTPDQKVIIGEPGLRWELSGISQEEMDNCFNGQVNYVGRDLVRRYMPIKALNGLVGT